MVSDLPNLALASQITTAFYRQMSSSFPMSSQPIHIDSARLIGNGVEVVWSYFDRHWECDHLIFGMRFTITISNQFWIEEQSKLRDLLELTVGNT
jgi:hypothetical protein